MESRDWDIESLPSTTSSHSSDPDAVVLNRDDASDFNPENILPQPADVLAKIRKYLEPTDYDVTAGEFKKHLESHLDGTGRWFLRSGAYPEWHASQEHGLLWIRGIPGSGKSVLAASLIDRLSSEKVPVLYFFFRQIIDANHSHASALRDWLVQVLNYSPPLQQELRKLLERGQNVSSISDPDLWSLLRLGLLHIPKAYIVVDALDEMDLNDAAKEFLRSLGSLAEWRPSQTKIVITSRPVPSVELPLRKAKALNVFLESRMVDLDIAAYVGHCLAKSAVAEDDQLIIKTAIPGKANGLFLYAKLAMDRFLQPDANVQQVVHNLPLDLNHLYTNLLREHTRRTGVSEEIQTLIMQWVTHASRPLRLLEIADLFHNIQNDRGRLSLKHFKNLVRSACGPLLEILPDETVCVVHHSLTEFLNGSTRAATPDGYPVFHFGPTHTRLALICLSYLNSGLLDELVAEGQMHLHPDQVLNRISISPFASYAASSWVTHMRKAASVGEIQEEITNFFSSLETEKIRIITILSIRPEEDVSKRGAHSIFQLPPIFYAVSLGLTGYTRALLESPGMDVNNSGSPYESLLCRAARNGYTDIVTLLLRHGANPTKPTHHLLNDRTRDCTPLMIATKNRHTDVVAALLDANVDPWTPEPRGYRFGMPPIQAACENGDIEVLAKFLPYIKTSQRAIMALRWAIKRYQTQAARLLLNHTDIDLDRKYDGTTLLYEACHRVQFEAIKLLLRGGANPNVLHDEDGLRENGTYVSVAHSTAFLALVREVCRRNTRTTVAEIDPEQMRECISCFIDAGVDINQVDHDGKTALHGVSDSAAVRLLLDAGANPEAVDNNGEAPLHMCDNTYIAELLLEEGSGDIDQQTTKEKRTPLLCALRRGNVELAKFFMDNGADPTIVDEDGNGPLHYAARIMTHNNGMACYNYQIEQLHLLTALVQDLVALGADIGLANHQGLTPVHCVAVSPKLNDEDLVVCLSGPNIHPTVLKAFLSAGADLEAKDYKGETPLFKVVCWDQNNMQGACDVLINEGARTDTTDDRGRNLLHALALHTRFDSGNLDYLIGQGVQPQAIDQDGNTLWHALAPQLSSMDFRESSKEIVQFSQLGVGPLQPNNHGQTGLHLLSMYRVGDINTRHSSLTKWQTCWEYILDLCDDVDDEDVDGATALHFAATFSEYNTKRLLAHGADPRKATREGMTPLHLAARARQPNIVGILLDALRSLRAPAEFPKALNARDNGPHKMTPLHYACASGQPETVRLLLEAGATDEPLSSFSVWDSCALFEDEEQNWLQSEVHGAERPDAGSVTIKGKRRPSPAHDRFSGSDGTKHDYAVERLDEIVQMLISHGPFLVEEAIERVISTARARGFTYTTGCMLRLRHKLGLDPPSSSLLAERAPEVSEDLIVQTASLSDESKFQQLMSLREYTLVGKTIPHKDFFEVDRDGNTPLRKLIEGGFSSIISDVATKDDNVDLIIDADDLPNPPPEPILLAACRTEAPNMNVLRMLVEKLGVDVNATSWRNPPRHTIEDELCKDETALHCLIRGGHWWQVAEALPYLVQHGANLEARDYCGHTPLGAALQKMDWIEFDKRAVEDLVKLGADVNSADDNGNPCLARATRDLEMTRLLLDHGAVITGHALLSAIRWQNMEAIQELLGRGCNPNVQHPGSLKGDGLLDVRFNIYPLHFAIERCSRSNRPEMVKPIVEMLLKNGADPFARSDKTKPTVIQGLIRSHYIDIVLFILETAVVDLEMRGENGETLLLTACRCRKQHHLINVLVDMGADVRAADDKGNSALHEFYAKSPSAYKVIAQRAPELAHQTNDQGITPLQSVLSTRERSIHMVDYVDTLLSAGVDPSKTFPDGSTALHGLLEGEVWTDDGEGIFEPLLRLLERLLSLGADLNATDSKGETPLFSFFRNGYLSRGLKPAPVAAAALLAFCEFFDRHGANWRAINADGESLLHAVASVSTRRLGNANKEVSAFQFLMSKGLDPMDENKKSQTALDVAATSSSRDILQLFERK
ncbi:ankyrin [Thozetella sp. PMI_491]|nr:ankyrin [Thozetella sp. PMI_491]